ncbi:hypothetical protein jhhlp_007901 [Lomentospora prolificans]|uniref:Major facilitator superfamily (MFS) profile domain-containing protein n=1 Tax=Lomentospora prolificans TaxID=41688 RepID=A0A2N3N0W8_9PEZI|nr:hypothetical protein jhhlp_007901 [Lomentospora prolificans]
MSPHGNDVVPIPTVIDGVAEHADEPSKELKKDEYSAQNPGAPPADQDSEPENGYDYIPLTIEALEKSTSISELLRAKGCSNPGWADSLAKGNPKFDSPFEWTSQKKLRILSGPFFASTLAAYSAGSYAMGAQPLMDRWNVGNTVFNIGITMFVLGFGFTPMILAPVSENYGRYWVFVGAGIVFTLGTLGCALTDSLAGMLLARLITGCGASVFATLTAGVVSDVYHKQDRNTPMTLYALTVMTGTGLGPLISGVLVDALSWRWIFYLQIILVGTNTVIILFFFTETRANVVLERLCDALNDHYETVIGPDPGRTRGQPIRFSVQVVQQKFTVAVIWRSFAFPLRLLVTESVVFWFSAWASFAWAILYLQFNSIGIVFRETYGFTTTELGAIYTAVIVGSILVAVISIGGDPILCRIWPERMAMPEGRLLPSCLESTMLPIGLFWFGWSAQAGAHWIVPTLAIGACTVGIFSIYLAVFNYLADTYHRYASSALAAQSMCRNLLAGVFPLITHLMFHNLTYGAASSLLGGIGFLLTGVPWLLCIFGETVRARSPFASDIKGGDLEEEVEQRNSEEV